MSDLKWVPASQVPKSWEGHQAFRQDGYDRKPYWTIIPKNFSREPQHCAGVFFCKIDLPPLFA